MTGRPEVDDVFAAHGVAVAYLFGSRAGDSFRVLVEVGVLDSALGERMVRLAGARNVIVHLYTTVDDALLARAVAEGGLDDLDAFARRIAALVA